MILYLSGGMVGDWQDYVIRETARAQYDIEYIDPRRNNTRDFNVYTALDLYHVRRCDVVLAYFEADNPSGIGLVAEVAFAKGLGKTVVLVNEKTDRYNKFVESFADVVFTKLDEGIEFINKLQI